MKPGLHPQPGDTSGKYFIVHEHLADSLTDEEQIVKDAIKNPIDEAGRVIVLEKREIFIGRYNAKALDGQEHEVVNDNARQNQAFDHWGEQVHNTPRVRLERG